MPFVGSPPSAPPAFAGETLGSVLDRIRRQLLSMRRGELNFLASSLSATATTFTFTDAAGGIVRSAYVGIDDELLYVRSVAGSVATVLRGVLGTTPASHAGGAELEVSPRFVRGDILDRMKEEVLSWPDEMFCTGPSKEITLNSTTRGYDFDVPDMRVILDVRGTTSGATTWPRIRNFEVVRGVPTTDFASGAAIFLGGSGLGRGRCPERLLVTYGTSFDTDSWTEEKLVGNTTGGVGLDASMVDLLEFGTLWRLMSAREILRTDMGSQVEPRVHEDVPPGHQINTATSLKRIRDARLEEEIDRLRRRWPWVFG